MNAVLWVAILTGAGLTLGVFFAVAVSVVPALLTMPPDRYVETQALLGKGYHPAMPIITNVTTLGAIALAIRVDQPLARALLIVGAVAVVGVQVVSHLGNVPINRVVATYRPGRSDGWTDPRPAWRAWHRLRTGLAVVAMLAFAVGVTAAV